MKKRVLALVLAAALICPMLFSAACKKEAPTITVWVGEESAEFYQGLLDQYKTDNEVPYQIVVKGVDSSSAAASFLNDPEAGADIFTVPHDNLAKLIGTSPVIAPVTDSALLAQIEADNSESFRQVITSKINDRSYVFAVPYISQALVLFYNKALVSEEQVKTWEGITEAAAAAGPDVKACTVMGNDGYNFSYLLLARQLPENSSTLRLYVDGVLNDCYCSGDDTLSVLRWGQRFFADPNGGSFKGTDDFATLLADGKVLSLVGGAWKFQSVKTALGDDLGITLLPTFTVTAEDVEGTSIPAGTEFRSGTFADCKVLVKSAYVDDEKDAWLDKIMLFLSSKEVQEQSFEQCNNLPAYKNAAEEFAAMKLDSNEARLAAMQVSMAGYGIPQPFAAHKFANQFYYSSGAPDIFMDLINRYDTATQTEAYTTLDEMKACLARIETIWKTGKAN